MCGTTVTRVCAPCLPAPPPGPLQHEGTLMAYYHGQRLQRSREWLHARRRSMLSQILAAIAPDPKVRVPARVVIGCVVSLSYDCLV